MPSVLSTGHNGEGAVHTVAQREVQSNDAVAARSIGFDIEGVHCAFGIGSAVPFVAVACRHLVHCHRAVVHGQVQVHGAVAARGVLQDHHGIIRAFDVGDTVPGVAVADGHLHDG